MNPVTRIENMAEYGFADLDIEEAMNMHKDAFELIKEIKQLQAELNQYKAGNVPVSQIISDNETMAIVIEELKAEIETLGLRFGPEEED
ncbi:MAG: hypothetical protein KAS32_10610 [Candidatus Peribacteraceae bacterium]|nr:hypothetical protein [Candidatus Peribacteraceae bacterium]